MSNSADEQEKPAGRGRSTLVIALTIGLVVGASAGSFVVGPLLAEDPTPAGGHAAEACLAPGAEEGHGAAPAAVYTIENLVLNPAQSGGSRYLMASVGFGLHDAHGAEVVATSDAALRDIVIRVLGARTVDQLADMTSRSLIKEEILAEVAPLLGQGTVTDVYFPQFVIQ